MTDRGENAHTCIIIGQEQGWYCVRIQKIKTCLIVVVRLVICNQATVYDILLSSKNFWEHFSSQNYFTWIFLPKIYLKWRFPDLRYNKHFATTKVQIFDKSTHFLTQVLKLAWFELTKISFQIHWVVSLYLRTTVPLIVACNSVSQSL